jgi:long-chain acyl-CoA synthetase
VLAENRGTLLRDLHLVRPTVLNAVPYVYQRIADHVRAGGAGDEAAALRNVLGGRMERLSCGGAALAPDVDAWFAARGMPILCGYGLTEASPVITATPPGQHRPGSVGRPLAGVEVKLAEDGEILVRSPGVMRGYWRDDAATAEAVRDGWLRTGDLGEFDSDGCLCIRGRKKEMIVLSTGKNVAPVRVETLLAASPLIEQAAVFGDGRPALVALIVPSPAAGVLAAEPVELQNLLAQELERCLSSTAREEQVRGFRILDRAFSIDRGELTPKLSLCRAVIAKNFTAELAAIE